MRSIALVSLVLFIASMICLLKHAMTNHFLMIEQKNAEIALQMENEKARQTAERYTLNTSAE